MLCEYVARGDRNKHTLINIFSGDVVVGDWPAHLVFGVYLEIIPDTETPIDIRLEIKLGRRKMVEAVINLKNQRLNTPAVFALPQFPIQIEEDSRLNIFISGIGEHQYRRKKILSKRIFKGDLG
tara:strand:- start:568 stop:939 length:372 start_codon:yes stop_codon:yes gene_type:complete